MKFTKMQGIGNDYVYVNCFKEKVEDPGEAAIKVSDRHFGIGSDGLILIKPSEVADFQMDMYNADGSRGAMCGNGIRCVAKYVYDYGLTDKTSVSVETASGIKYLDLTVENGKVVLVKVNMGAPILEAAKIPVVSEKEQVINEPLLVDGKEYRITGVSMGNPHAITYIDDVKGLDIEKIGPKFEFHPAFPDRVNTEFVKVLETWFRRDTGMWNRCLCGSCGLDSERICERRGSNSKTARRGSEDLLGSGRKPCIHDRAGSGCV